MDGRFRSRLGAGVGLRSNQDGRELWIVVARRPIGLDYVYAKAVAASIDGGVVAWNVGDVLVET
jgi:hypothetical protein